MSTEALTRKQQLGLFTAILTFMDELCWAPARQEKQTWIPESVNTLEAKSKEKQRGKTRVAMEKAGTYLAMAEIGIGLDPKRVEMSMLAIKNWKFYFVENMKDKENIQMKQGCLDNIRLGAKIGKKYKCSHKNHLLGKKGAAELADVIFKIYYDNEIRALRETGISPYFSRDAGPVEFGESLSDEQYMARQFVEVPQGEFYLAKEDENATGFSLSDVSDFYKSDDEVVETESGREIIPDFSARNEKWGDMRRAVMRAPNQDARERLVREAENLAKMDVIAQWQARNVRYFSWQCNVYYAKEAHQKKAQERAEAVVEHNGEDVWMVL